MKRSTLLIVSLSLFLLSSHAQDKIYRNNGQVIEARVIEISDDEIRYKEYDNPDGPLYVLETDRIKKIVFQNGVTQKFRDNLRDPERYAGQLSRALKLNFFAPLYGYTEIGFEKSTGVGKGYEVSLGIIGLGKSEILEDQSQTVKMGQAGAFFSAGYKFGKLPDYLFFGRTRLTHLMQGTYVKPILYFGYYAENQLVTKVNSAVPDIEKQHVVFGALQVELGHQWVFGDRFLVDMYEGFGYGVDNKKSSDIDPYDSDFDEAVFNYANARFGKSPSFSFTFGIKLGWLIK